MLVLFAGFCFSLFCLFFLEFLVQDGGQNVFFFFDKVNDMIGYLLASFGGDTYYAMKRNCASLGFMDMIRIYIIEIIILLVMVSKMDGLLH